MALLLEVGDTVEDAPVEFRERFGGRCLFHGLRITTAATMRNSPHVPEP
jgi:hypothetical protein